MATERLTVVETDLGRPVPDEAPKSPGGTVRTVQAGRLGPDPDSREHDECSANPDHRPDAKPVSLLDPIHKDGTRSTGGVEDEGEG